MTSVFVDTNVLIYTRDTEAPTKSLRSQMWLSHLTDRDGLILNAQVLNEAYVVLIGRRRRVPRSEARQFVAPLRRFATAPVGLTLLASAWRIEDAAMVAWYDALLLASANAAGCTHFLSEDLNNGQLYGRVRAVNPFRHAPEDVLGRAP